MVISRCWRASALGALVTVSALSLGACSKAPESGKDNASSIELLNVSYDPTRELYEAVNPLFAASWREKTGEDVKINMSHGGAGKQARAVMDGLEADVVTLNVGYDINEIAKRTDALSEDWQSRLPNNSSPYTSTIVFLVRERNPKNIADWDDLVRPGIEVITPNPKTSGGARWNFLAAWAFAREKYGSDAAARDFVTKLYANVPVLDSGARGSTITFTQRGIGDVLLAWENEAFLALEELGEDKFDIVVPSVSILAEPPVAVLDGNAKEHGTLEAAEAYLRFLYTPQAQRIIAKNYYRPINPKVAKEFEAQFPKINLITVDGAFGGWDEAQPRFFNDGGVFDEIFAQAKR